MNHIKLEGEKEKLQTRTPGNKGGRTLRLKKKTSISDLIQKQAPTKDICTEENTSEDDPADRQDMREKDTHDHDRRMRREDPKRIQHQRGLNKEGGDTSRKKCRRDEELVCQGRYRNQDNTGRTTPSNWYTRSSTNVTLWDSANHVVTSCAPLLKDGSINQSSIKNSSTRFSICLFLK